MTGDVQPPPPQRQPDSTGCFGKGCLILAVLILFLMIAGAIGLYYGAKHYSAVTRAVMFATKVGAVSRTPAPVPQFQTTPEKIQASTQKWEAFQAAAEQGQPAAVELTADDLNNMIARNRHIRGKVFVSITGNRLDVQTSIPVGEYVRLNGYLNAHITVQTNGPRSLNSAPLNTITVNGQPLPGDARGWSYSGYSINQYIAPYAQTLSSFEIRDGKLILSQR
ncbi:MAG: hypothetical protein JO354_12615 [Verrucomicrobia bacterium]|nr:hypothetical protein [Verrucomicrobiota bacterium]